MVIGRYWNPVQDQEPFPGIANGLPLDSQTSRRRPPCVQMPTGCGHFGDAPLAVHPPGLNEIEPGAHNWQAADQQPNALAHLLDLVIVLPNPLTNCLTELPSDIIPDDDQDELAQRLHSGTTPRQELASDSTNVSA